MDECEFDDIDDDDVNKLSHHLKVVHVPDPEETEIVITEATITKNLHCPLLPSSRAKRIISSSNAASSSTSSFFPLALLRFRHLVMILRTSRLSDAVLRDRDFTIICIIQLQI